MFVIIIVIIIIIFIIIIIVIIIITIIVIVINLFSSPLQYTPEWYRMCLVMFSISLGYLE